MTCGTEDGPLKWNRWTSWLVQTSLHHIPCETLVHTSEGLPGQSARPLPHFSPPHTQTHTNLQFRELFFSFNNIYSLLNFAESP